MKKLKIYFVLIVLISLFIFPTKGVFANDPSIQVSNVPAIDQLPELPTGCEMTALTMLLRWGGINVEKEEVADNIAKVTEPSLVNNEMVGGNPNEGFIGDPHSEEGFGVYHKPITAELNHYVPGKAEDLTGASFDKVLQIVDSGRPVVVWITYQLQEPSLQASWYDPQGKEVDWYVPEHVVLIIGNNENEVIVNDPLTGSIEHYPRDLFQKRFSQMGNQAVTIANNSGFDDVPDNSSYSSYITDLHRKGKIAGNGEGSFSPIDNLTRAEFVTMFVKAFNIPESNQPDAFEDVPDWARSFVQTAYSAGVTKGYNEKQFGADDFIPREQAATMVWNWLSNNGVKAVQGSNNNPKDISDFAIIPVQNILVYQLYGPEVDSQGYHAKQNMTRQEAAALFDLAMQQLSKN